MATILESVMSVAEASGAEGSAETISGAINLLTEAMGGTPGSTMISDAAAQLGPFVAPTGTLQIAENGTHSVAVYASAEVDVPAYLVQFSANGGSGSVDPMACAAGTEYEPPAGTGLTPPEGKQFAGWGATDDAETALDSIEATADATLYAIWETA